MTLNLADEGEAIICLTPLIYIAKPINAGWVYQNENPIQVESKLEISIHKVIAIQQ